VLQRIHIVLGKVQKKSAVSCPFLLTFPSHCIRDAVDDFYMHFFVYNTPFWNKFIVDET
jgi:hypothetical protein